MADLGTIAGLIREQTEINELSTEMVRDEIAETNDNIQEMIGFLVSDRREQREARREERDDRLDKDLKDKIKQKDKSELPPQRIRGGISPLGAAAGFLGISTGLLGGLLGILARWEQKKDEIDQSIQGALTSINGIVAAPVITSFLGKVRGLTKGAISSVIKFFSLGFNKIAIPITAAIQAELAVLRAGGATLKPGWAKTFKLIGGLWNGLKGISGFLSKVVSTGSKFIKPFFKFAGGFLSFFGRLSGVFTIAIAFFDGIRAFWKEWETGERNIFRLFRVGVEGALKGFLSLIGDVGGVFGWMAEKFLTFIGVSEEKSAAIRGIITSSFEVIEAILTRVVGIFGDIFEYVGNVITNLWGIFSNSDTTLKEKGSAFLGMIGAGLGNLVGVVKGFFKGLLSPITSSKNLVKKFTGGSDNEDGQAIIKAFKGLRDNMNKLLKKMTDGIVKRWEGVKAWFGKQKAKHFQRLTTEEAIRQGYIPPSDERTQVMSTPVRATGMKLKSASQTIAQHETRQAVAISAPSVTQNSSSVNVSSNSQLVSIPPSASNRADPHAYGIR